MTRNAVAVLIVASVCLLSGCVVGNTHTFNYLPTQRSEVGGGRIVLLFSVDDQRPYIVSRSEPANFVGEQRNGYGVPFNVTTSDGRPFAQVVQETAQRDLEAAGFRVTASREKGTDVPSATRDAKASRALMIVMREFKSDTYKNINFDYDFEAIVYDASGKEIERAKVAGEEELPGSFMNPPRSAREQVPAHFYGKIHALLTGNERILKALTN
jgi:hypothetical protein